MLQGLAPLHHAAATNHAAMARLLLTFGASPNIRTNQACALHSRSFDQITEVSGHTVLLSCCSTSHTIAQMCIESAAQSLRSIIYFVPEHTKSGTHEPTVMHIAVLQMTLTCSKGHHSVDQEIVACLCCRPLMSKERQISLRNLVNCYMGYSSTDAWCFCRV